MATVAEQLLELERRFWGAAGDAAFYRMHFADDGLMAFHVGIMDKGEVLDAMRGTAEWESYTVDDLRFVQVSDDVAFLTYTTRAVAAGDPEPYVAAISSVYARRGGRWLLVLHQQTPQAIGQR
jgi:ketosteroid isomerase-like protein